ncbi:MAG: ice-binding family protein [Bacteroidota bacterium]
MKTNTEKLIHARLRFSRLFSASLFAILMIPAFAVCQATVDLGTAASFGVLSAAGITGTATITGDVGTATGSISGGIWASGIIYPVADPAVAQAHTDLLAAYRDAESRIPSSTIGTELGGETLTPGVYYATNFTFGITTTLTLDGLGSTNAVFIFQAQTTLITAGSSQVVLINGAQWTNIFWQIGSSATLGEYSLLEGSILANTSISAGQSANVHGRLLAGAVTSTGAVSLLGNTALPVELVSFSATANRLNCDLLWTTATELNNYGFEIERRSVQSGPAQEIEQRHQKWIRIGFVQGAGTSSSPHKYSYNDRGLNPGKYEYRIKQIDRDGTFDYCSTVEVDVGLMPKVLMLGVSYPNPFPRNTNIEFTLARDDVAVVKVYNLHAQEVASLFEGTAEAGRLYQCRFDASQVSYGMYFVRLEANGQTRMQKIVYVK